jgi:hypothetical protein
VTKSFKYLGEIYILHSKEIECINQWGQVDTFDEKNVQKSHARARLTSQPGLLGQWIRALC